jgi:hypothetical protein
MRSPAFDAGAAATCERLDLRLMGTYDLRDRQQGDARIQARWP